MKTKQCTWPTWRANRASKALSANHQGLHRQKSRHGFIWPRSVFHKPYGAAMKAIRIFPRFLSFRGDWLLEWWVGGAVRSGCAGGGRCWGVERGTGSSGKRNYTGIYFKCIYKVKWGKNPTVFLLGHVREPLAKIIIYEGREERERQRLSIIRDTVKHTEAAGRLN